MTVKGKAAVLTKNDQRVLEAVERACDLWDGFIPHGARDWTAIKRLGDEALVDRSADFGVCDTCREQHEGPLYTLTSHGRQALTSEPSR